MSSNPSTDDYLERTNAAIDYIVRNLDGELKLDDVARVACFSPFHFHRIFRSMMGETLNQFVKRQRLERAVYFMSHTPNKSLTQIAHECGFSSSSDFSRSFKKHFGSAPSDFDLKEYRDGRRDELAASMASYENGPNLRRLPEGANPDGFEVELCELPPRTVAYIRVLDPYQSLAVPEACERLVHWAESRGLADGQWLGYMWEDPEIVALKDCRYDVAVVVDTTEHDFGPAGEIGRFEFPEMRVAQVRIRGDIELEQRALDWLFGTWLPRSGFSPDNQPAFEAWHGRPFEHGFEHFELDCHLPIK